MAEILVKAVDYTHPDPDKDRRGAYKRGYPVVVMPDGHAWGGRERLPRFVVIKFPGVATDNPRLREYITPEYTDELDPDGVPMRNVYRRRLWRIRWDDLPAAAKARLRDDGELIIKASVAYEGPYDYTWAQVKSYFLNQRTLLDETRDIE